MRISVTEFPTRLCLHQLFTVTFPPICAESQQIAFSKPTVVHFCKCGWCYNWCLLRHLLMLASCFSNTILHGSWKCLKRGCINNPWILCPCINAAPTYKCKSLVGHCFDTFQSFSLALWQLSFDWWQQKEWGNLRAGLGDNWLAENDSVCSTELVCCSLEEESETGAREQGGAGKDEGIMG